jgi:hypothetical protein
MKTAIEEAKKPGELNWGETVGINQQPEPPGKNQ